ncbi:MAG: metal-dependent transcriptional regulator [Anaerolinea sp.]|nr:metal-dependent transcriptional regulator [Anaerolinea sp.]
MQKENLEMYVGVIYRLRADANTPVPLPKLKAYFGFTLISIHEMIQKLEGAQLVHYIRYKGVTLTAQGEQIAAALIRRHRIWERFLNDQLGIPIEQVHEIADALEHAAPELVTERLAALLGEPESCPHGSHIPHSQTA